jgi:hypothetical protein
VWSGDALLTPKVDYVVVGRGEFDPERCVNVVPMNLGGANLSIPVLGSLSWVED